MDFSRLDRRRDLILLRNLEVLTCSPCRHCCADLRPKTSSSKPWPAALLSDAPLCWVAVEELNLTYYMGETPLSAIYPFWSLNLSSSTATRRHTPLLAGSNRLHPCRRSSGPYLMRQRRSLQAAIGPLRHLRLAPFFLVPSSSPMNGSNVAAAALNYRILCPTAPYSPSLPIRDLNKPDVEFHGCS